jgi:nucleoside-diphosphate-sugar epimerase
MRVLILGGNGFLGPHVVRELERDHELLVTDMGPVDTKHPTQSVDIADWDQVRRAAQNTDAIVNCSVQRQDRRGAFSVNTQGTLNALRAAVEQGHQRFINTGPRFTVVGPSYLEYDFGIREEVPPHPGTGLYALSKSLGQELCRVYAQRHPIHVLTLLFSSFVDPAPAHSPVEGMNPFAVTFADAARGVRCALEVDPECLPSRCEIFFMSVDLPQDQVRHGKARRLLGWQPQHSLGDYYRLGSGLTD